MLKRFAIATLCLILAGIVFVIPMAAAESPVITVMLDGAEMEFDVPPQIISGHTMVPMRIIFEALNATVEWDDKTQTVTGVKNDTTVIMRIDDPIMLVDDAEIIIDAPPVLIDGRALVPFKAISESLGMEVGWCYDTHTVIISSPPIDAVPVAVTHISPELGMMVVINNADWDLYNDEATGAVYFFDHRTHPSQTNPQAYGIISISAFPFFGDFSRLAEMEWAGWEEYVETRPYARQYTFNDRQEIQVGPGQYPGYLHTGIFIEPETIIKLNIVFWTAGGMFYICATAADQDVAEELQAVLDGILESFISLESLNQ